MLEARCDCDPSFTPIQNTTLFSIGDKSESYISQSSGGKKKIITTEVKVLAQDKDHSSEDSIVSCTLSHKTKSSIELIKFTESSTCARLHHTFSAPRCVNSISGRGTFTHLNRNKGQVVFHKPPLNPARSPSPRLYERLTNASTKSTQLRRESTHMRKRLLERESHGKRVPFYCTVSPRAVGDTESIIRTAYSRSVQSPGRNCGHSFEDYSVISFPSLPDDEESEVLSYMKKEETQSRSSCFTPKQQKIIPCRNDYSPLHDRLAATMTKSTELSLRAKKIDGNRKELDGYNSNGKCRPRFQCRVNTTSSISPRAVSAPTPPRVRSLSPTRTFLNLSTAVSTQTQSRGKPLKKKSESELDIIFTRLAYMDTVASSKKVVFCPNRPVLLTQHEQNEMAMMREKQRKRRNSQTSQALFDFLAKESTMSLLYKRYEETKDN